MEKRQRSDKMAFATLKDRSKFTATEYNLPSFDEFTKFLEDAVRKAVDDFVRGAASELASVYLRSADDFDPAHPMKVDIRIPLGREDDPPTWEFDLEKEFRDFADDRFGAVGGVDDYDRPTVQAIRDKLVELVAFYDEKLGK